MRRGTAKKHSKRAGRKTYKDVIKLRLGKGVSREDLARAWCEFPTPFPPKILRESTALLLEKMQRWEAADAVKKA